MSIRPATKAGSWYSDNPDALARELNGYLDAVDVSKASLVAAAIVPHAGLAFSGPVAARAYARIRAASPDTDTFIVFGAVHTMRLERPAIWSTGAWSTPLGEIPVDDSLAARMIDAGIGTDDEAPHIGDNAIELQTPFIRHCFPKASIIPVAAPPTESSLQAGITLAELLKRQGRAAVIIGSTDLTHYGQEYGFSPKGTGDKAHEWAKQNDRALIDAMCRLEAESIIPHAQRDHSACGAGAVAATVAYARAIGAPKGELLAHTTSHEIMPRGPASHFVGYGAVVFPTPED